MIMSVVCEEKLFVGLCYSAKLILSFRVITRNLFEGDKCTTCQFQKISHYRLR